MVYCLDQPLPRLQQFGMDLLFYFFYPRKRPEIVDDSASESEGEEEVAEADPTAVNEALYEEY